MNTINVRGWTLLLVIVFLMMLSCVSTQTRMLNQATMENTKVVGIVETKTTSFQFLHIPIYAAIKNKVYRSLMMEAQRKYVGKMVDVVNIRMDGSISDSYALISVAFIGLPLLIGNEQEIVAVGDVILLDGSQPDLNERSLMKTSASVGINKPKGQEDTVRKMCLNMVNKIPIGSKIAVINVTTDNVNTSSFILDEIEFNLVSAEVFTIVDRRTLNLILEEHLIQASGSFDDETLVRFGRLSGANVVITSSVIRSSNTNRISMRAIDVQRGQIITMVRDSY